MLNGQIVVGTACRTAASRPTSCSTRRDQLISQLSPSWSASPPPPRATAPSMCSSATASRLVLQGQTTQADHGAESIQCLAARDIDRSALNGNVISGSKVTSGDLGGFTARRARQVINPALNQLGQIATAVTQTVNAQQADGAGFVRPVSARRFSPVGADSARGCLDAQHRRHHRGRDRSSNLGGLTSDDYVLSYNAGASLLAHGL